MDYSVKSLVSDKVSKERPRAPCCSKISILLLVVAFCFLSTLFYSVFPDRVEFKGEASAISSPDVLKPSSSQRPSQGTFEDLDKFLCAQESEPPNNTRTVSRKPCPTRGIISAVAGGRTGNQMWEYASIWALGKKLGLEPFVPTCVKWKLEVMFDNLLLPTFRAIAHCPFDLNSAVSTVGKANNGQSLILPRFSFRISESLPWMTEILKEFNFRNELKDKAQHTLREMLPPASMLNYTFIAVHVRRTDYIKYVQRRFHREPVTENFFRNAMAYYRERFVNCAFIYISDDPDWCFNHFGHMANVYVASYKSSSTEEDLALMQACNHSIIDYGTFGEWGSILAGGHTVASHTQVIHEATRKWGHWTLVDDVDKSSEIAVAAASKQLGAPLNNRGRDQPMRKKRRRGLPPPPKVSLIDQKADWNGTMFPFRGTLELIKAKVVEEVISDFEDDEWQTMWKAELLQVLCQKVKMTVSNVDSDNGPPEEVKAVKTADNSHLKTTGLSTDDSN